MFGSLTAANAKKFFYFFYQLNEEEQKAYNEVVTGMLSASPEITLTAQVNAEEINEVSRAIYLDQPAIFWDNGTFSYSFDGQHVVGFRPEYRAYADLPAARTALENVKDTVLAAVASMTDDEKVAYIHDYVVKNVYYEFTTGYDQTTHHALVEGSAICEGYARSMQYLAMAAGIPCYFSEGIADSGSAVENHAWNIVMLNGNYYNLDATWDEEHSTDPASTLGLRDYFLLTDAEIGTDHTRTDYGLRLPACTVEYPFETIYGYSRAVAPLVNLSGVKTIVNSLDEFRALRKSELIKQCPGTARYSFIVPVDVYDDILDYMSDDDLWKQEFIEAAQALNLNGFSFGAGGSIPAQTVGALLFEAEDELTVTP